MLNISLAYQFPTWMQRLAPHYRWRGDALRKVVYLTFDDGPIPEVTPHVLDILAHYGVLATFFMVGDNVQRYPEVYHQVLEAGHLVGNHTMHHMRGWQVSTSEYMHDVAQAEALMPQTRWFRPPHGRLKPSQRRQLIAEGYTLCLWDVLTHDYHPSYTPQRMMAVIRRYTRPGSIINFHDSLKSQERMLEVLPQAIEYLHREGYQFETLDGQTITDFQQS